MLKLIIRPFIWFAAIVFVVSLIVHGSTFFGIDPFSIWSGVMWLHLAIFPPFIAAICFARYVGGKDSSHQERIWQCAPRWLKYVAGFFFFYAFCNFAACEVLSEGGGPSEHNGKYSITSHGRVIREITETEYHQARAYEVRGYSGHWLGFSVIALTLLVGSERAHCSLPIQSATTEPLPIEPEKMPDLPPEPTTRRRGLGALFLYVLSVLLILCKFPICSVVATIPVIVAMIIAMWRRRGFPHGNLESGIGCLTIFPNALLGSFMGRNVAEFIYVAAYVGFGAAISHDVSVMFPKEGPAQLSNGELLNNRVWSALMFFVHFPLFAIGSIGLTYLAEHFGRLVEVRRKPLEQPNSSTDNHANE